MRRWTYIAQCAAAALRADAERALLVSVVRNHMEGLLFDGALSGGRVLGGGGACAERWVGGRGLAGLLSQVTGRARQSGCRGCT